MLKNMDADIVGGIITLGLVLALMICITIGSIINHGKDVELEKYKIQMQVYGEPVNQISEVERKY